ncbi:hypothetical protein [Rhodococcoides fascians]|uniref:hypothetical protein n=1 Tax=Rhodococcoides fascians TaxID=1828 RepID=UPI000A8085A9|nr:hypothetical protein [Rhodococcus fascians]
MDEIDNVVPMWTLATQDVKLPVVSDEDSLTPGRVAELRTVLAALTDAPLATLEAHSLPSAANLSGGIHLESASPLATQLSQLIQSSRSGSGQTLHSSGETLYRMVVPAKFAGQVASGVVKPMQAKDAVDGVRSVLVGPSGIVGHANLVPVAAKSAAFGAAGGTAAGAGAAVAGATALTIAAPLVLMAVAVGLNARAERNRQESIDKIVGLLEELKDNALTAERSALNACIPIIDTAAAVLLDEGKIGAALGLDSAVYQINVGLANAENRLTGWEGALAGFKDDRVEVGPLNKAFIGIGEEGGEFRAQLELAKLAIDLMQRVLVLQAVEQAQSDPENLFEGFARALKKHKKRVDAVQQRINTLLLRLSSLEIDRTRGVRDFVFTSSQVDELLRTSRRVRELQDSVDNVGPQPDVAIEIARKSDGSLIVLPAMTA